MTARTPKSNENSNGENERKIPKAVIKRLSLYSRILQQLERGKVEKVSSTDLAVMLGLNSAQVRKDLAYFGQFGVPGYGYHVAELRRNIKHILGTDREIRVALVGVGNLGTALLSYDGFSRQGFRVICGFDSRPEAVQSRTDAPPVFHVDQLERRLREYGIDFAILTVPVDAAQPVTDRLVNAGVTAILNFVPCRLQTPDNVKVHYVDLAIEMESLTYYLRQE